VGSRGKGRREGTGKGKRGGKGGERVPKCPNPELASLANPDFKGTPL